jgi:hypothetical protein
MIVAEALRVGETLQQYQAFKEYEVGGCVHMCCCVVCVCVCVCVFVYMCLCVCVYVFVCVCVCVSHVYMHCNVYCMHVCLNQGLSDEHQSIFAPQKILEKELDDFVAKV